MCLGFVDIKKAFDSANVWGILLLLQKKVVHPEIINILEHWFSISSAKIKWNDTLSKSVSLTSGVRQGGILSPLLFSAFIDNILSILQSSNRGCFINKECFNSFLYADDLLLVSLSVTDLQDLLNLASDSFCSLGLQINPAKSNCLRVGRRFKVVCEEILVSGSPLPWVKEAKYLGVYLKSGKSFSCNWSTARRNFYVAVNGILGALGREPPLNVLLALVKSNCFPLLHYGIASMPLTATEKRNFSFAYGSVFNKNFKVSNALVIEQCQYFCYVLPFNALYDYMRFCFLIDRFNRGRLVASNPVDKPDSEELALIALKYNFLNTDSKYQIKCKLWKNIEGILF